MKRSVVPLMTALFCAPLAAAIFGGGPYEVFDQGGADHLLFGNTFLADQRTINGLSGDRQGDTCVAVSSSVLTAEDIPLDAEPFKAYLVWTGAVDPAKLEEPTDHTVHLSFVREDGYLYDTDIAAGAAPRYLGDTEDPFTFESVRFTADVLVGCSETAPGTPTAAELAYFTYRADATDFFERILRDNALTAAPMMPGQAVAGTYTVSGLDCTDDDSYRCSTLMVSNWAMLIVYRSGNIHPPQDIYLYPGFAFLKEESVDTRIEGLVLPVDTPVRMTMLSAEGDPALMTARGGFETVAVRGNDGAVVPITGDCDPEDDAVNEVWDSRRSFFALSESGAYCTAYDDEPYAFGLDIDRWALDPTIDTRLAGIFSEGGDAIDLRFRFAADEVLTNLLVLSTERPVFDFDVPGADELRNCPCVPEGTRDIFCEEEPLYILLTVENWGETFAESVYVQADYDRSVFDYVAGTTEIATQFDDSGNGLNWQVFLDGPAGAFPLAEPDLIANNLDSSLAASDTALSYRIRFQLLPKKELPKNTVGKVSAVISDADSSYRTNHNLPLRLYPGSCLETCTEKELRERCGGMSSDTPQIYDPQEKDEDVTDADEVPDPVPDSAIDPRATHPMSAQTPGCSLVLF